MEISYIGCNHDIEDKLNLIQFEPTSLRPVALCQIDARDHLHYPLTKSLTTQTQICRFTQEALHAQFHLLRQKSAELSLHQIELALSVTTKQLSFFLKNHGWQAQVHSVIIIPPSLLNSDVAIKSKEPKPFTLVTVGQPCILGYHLQHGEVQSLIDHKNFNSYPLGSPYSLSFQYHQFYLEHYKRLLIASPSWPQLRPHRLTELFIAPWIELPQLISEMISADEIDNHPFCMVQLEPRYNKFWRSFYYLSHQLHQKMLHLLALDR